MLSNSSKYAINAVIYLAIHSSASHRIAPKDVAEALHIPTPFLAKILQTLARKKVISSNHQFRYLSLTSTYAVRMYHG